MVKAKLFGVGLRGSARPAAQGTPASDGVTAQHTGRSAGPDLVMRVGPATVSEVYDTYWRFAAERQAIFFRRRLSVPQPWTSDTVLAKYKFTNAYRASDRTSQYLIRNVIYRDDLPNCVEEVVFRVLLFKFFNRIATWELLEQTLGAITFAEYDYRSYDAILSRARSEGRRLYSAAYIMPPGGGRGSRIKHQNHLVLLETMMKDMLPEKLAAAHSMREGFALLRAYPTVGDFLAYQFITDINYSECTNFSEMEFVVPGPGARDGLSKCFVDRGGLDESDLIRFVADRQEREFERLGLWFQTLWGRRLQLIDCQNLFCELSKYARMTHPKVRGIAGRSRIKQRFGPNMAEMDLFYPPKWRLGREVQGPPVGLPLLRR